MRRSGPAVGAKARCSSSSRGPRLRAPSLAVITALILAATAATAAPKRTKKRPNGAPAAVEPADPDGSSPSKSQAAPSGAAAPNKADPASPTAGSPPEAAASPPASSPVVAPPAAPPALRPTDRADGLSDKVVRAVRPLWQGGFIQVQVGYGVAGGVAGPLIPDPKGLIINGGFEAWRKQGCVASGFSCYDKAITTDTGTGLAAVLQFGYNILGWASLWLDLAWKGRFGGKAEMDGTGAISLMAGFHPLRAWRHDPPFDLRLYGGYGVFDILYYHESEIQVEVEGKAWTGTSIPFGLSAEWRVPDSTFAIGLDLRGVRGTYTSWIYNNDKDIASDLSANPQTTMRLEGRVIFAWHL